MIANVITEQFIFYLIAFTIGFLAFYIAISGFRPILRLPFRRTSRKKSPINDDLLNYPGKSLADRIQNETLDATMLSIFLMLTPPFLLLIFSVFPKYKTAGIGYIILIIATLIITAFFCWKLYNRFHQIRLCRMGLDGERATGEELNHLMKHGYRVYHDLQAGKFNIEA